MRAATRPLLAALAAALLAGGRQRRPRSRRPTTSGAAALVVDARTGEAMHAENAGEPRPIASATKLMTALLTLERAELDDVFPAAPYSASPVESKINLMAGERMTVRDLLTALAARERERRRGDARGGSRGLARGVRARDEPARGRARV